MAAMPTKGVLRAGLTAKAAGISSRPKASLFGGDVVRGSNLRIA